MFGIIAAPAADLRAAHPCGRRIRRTRASRPSTGSVAWLPLLMAIFGQLAVLAGQGHGLRQLPVDRLGAMADRRPDRDVRRRRRLSPGDQRPAGHRRRDGRRHDLLRRPAVGVSTRRWRSGCRTCASMSRDSALIAALARRPGGHRLRRWRHGTRSDPIRIEVLRGATWRAARFGLRGELLDHRSRELVPAWAMVDALVQHVLHAATGQRRPGLRPGRDRPPARHRHRRRPATGRVRPPGAAVRRRAERGPAHPRVGRSGPPFWS